jgi:hypothetical protein
MKRKNKPLLSIENAREFNAKIEWEGSLDYVLQNWDFKEFKDKKFNSLRKAYIKAHQDMMDYCYLDRVLEDTTEPSDLDESDRCPSCGDALELNGTCYTCTGEQNEN